MALNGKYTIKERKIAREIQRLKRKQKHLFNCWHLVDIKLTELKQRLNEKYTFNHKL